MNAGNRANSAKPKISVGQGFRKAHPVSVLLLYCLLNYWHIAESYVVTPATRMNSDRSLNWLGSIHFTFWAVAPLIAWGLFIWILVITLKQYVLNLPGGSVGPEFTPAIPFYRQMATSTVRVALVVSITFGIARLALDIFELNFFAGHFHMNTTYYEAFMRFLQMIVVYVSVALFMVYKNCDEIETDKIIHSIIIALILIYVPGYIIYFIGQCIILDIAWWFPIPDGHGWSESQINMADTFSLLSQWLPLVFSGILFSYILKRLKATMKKRA